MLLSHFPLWDLICKIVCISILYDDPEGINYDYSWWFVFLAVCHTIFFLLHFFSRGSIIWEAILLPSVTFFTSLIVLDIILIYLASHLATYHLQFWGEGKIISEN